ncbi:MAG: helix-turn-helix domain-containing protein [Oscillospiraceae bacterium]|nr:helix-turn-helix domain-containing protein [Oscillospiraceae bacterium]
MKPNIGENIKKLRNEKQVTQEQLAEHLCISYQAVSKWENNVTTPDIFLLPAIAEYFEVPIDELFKVNMKGYKNKAHRLFALYCYSHTKENFEKADSEYEKLIAENKIDKEDMACYGQLYQFRAQDFNKKAEEIYNKSIEMGAQMEGQLRYLLATQGRHKENIEKYEERVKNDPDNAVNWYGLASSYSGTYGDGINPEKALEIIKNGLEKFPNDALLLNLYGETCRGVKRYDEAIEYFKKSVEQKPDMGDNYYGMAFTYNEMGKYKESIWAWEEVIALHERVIFNEEEIELATEWPKREIAKLQGFLNQ